MDPNTGLIDLTTSAIPSLLTARQKTELLQAMLDFLTTNGYKESAEALKKESSVQADPKAKGMLEKKWASIVRMQKKIMELEAENKTLKENESDRGRPDYSKDALPRAPAKQSLRGHRDDITAVRFHPLYDLVASTSEDATTRIWDFETGQVEKTLKGHTGAVRDVDFHPKGELMATCSNDLTIKLWDPKTGSCSKTLHGHDHTVSSVRFLPSGDFLVSASRDKTIKVWEIATGYCTQTLKGHEKWVRKLAVSHDGAYVVSAGSDHTVHVWDMKTFKSVTLFSLHDNVVEDVAFASPEACKTIFRSLQLAAASAASGGAVTDVPETAGAQIPLYVASCGRDKTIRIFEALSGNLVMQFNDHDNWVRSVGFHPDGRHLVSVSDDRSIKVWGLKEQRCVRTLNDAHSGFVQCMDFNVRNPHLATGGASDHVVNIWACR